MRKTLLALTCLSAVLAGCSQAEDAANREFDTQFRANCIAAKQNPSRRRNLQSTHHAHDGRLAGPGGSLHPGRGGGIGRARLRLFRALAGRLRHGRIAGRWASMALL